MYKKIIKYEDFEGVSRTEEAYFNLTDAEVSKWLLTTGDYTLDKVLERLTKKINGKEIMEHFENLIRLSYGRKSLDGRRFEKSKEIWEDFSQTNAYSIFFMELITDARKAAEFINNIIPKEMADKVEKAMKENPEAIPEELRDYVGVKKK